MKYIKIKDNQISEVANSRYIKVGSIITVNPTYEDYINAGYLPLNEGDNLPEDREGFTLVSKYRYNEDNTAIEKYYEYVETPVVEEHNEEEM